MTQETPLANPLVQTARPRDTVFGTITWNPDRTRSVPTLRIRLRSQNIRPRQYLCEQSAAVSRAIRYMTIVPSSVLVVPLWPLFQNRLDLPFLLDSTHCFRLDSTYSFRFDLTQFFPILSDPGLTH